MKRILNTKFSICLLAALLVGGAALHALHEFQGKRLAGVWLMEAKQAEEKGEDWQRLLYLNRYLTYQPADYDVFAEYALLLDQTARSPQVRAQADALLQRALIQQPDRLDLRERMARCAMRQGRFSEAKEHLQILLQMSPRNDEFEYLLGRCLEATGDYTHAVDCYENATHHNPTQLDSYVRLADLMKYRLEDPTEARAVLDRMVATNQHSYQAFLIRARIHKNEGRGEQARQDVKQALELAPTEPALLLFAADLAPAAGHAEDLRAQFRAGLAAHPRHAGLYQALAKLEVLAKRPQEAIACLRQGLAHLPEQQELLQSLCDLLVQDGNLPEAGSLIARLRHLNCRAARAGYWDARVLIQQKRWPEAVRLLETAAKELEASPEWTTPVQIALGYCFEQLGDRDRQLAAYRRAVAADPNSAAARLGLGDALLALGTGELAGEMDQAIKQYLCALDLGMRRPALTDRLVQLLYQRRRYVEADYVIRLTREQEPLQGQRAMLAAEIALANGNHSRALELAHQAIRGTPTDYRTQIWLSHILAAAGKNEESEKTLRDVVEQFDTISDTWIALVQHLAQAGKSDEAENAILQMKEHLPADQVPLALASCYQALGQPARAQEQYQLALAAHPDDFIALQKAADFFLNTGRPERAQVYLRRLIAPSVFAPAEQAAWARRRLALILADRGKQEGIREALTLLEQNRTTPCDPVEDQRVRARVLAFRSEHQAEALRLLEESMTARPLTPDEEHCLARLYQARGDSMKAREHLLNVLTSQGQNVLYLTDYIQNLVTSGEVSEARRWFAKLERLAPDAATTQAIKAELMKPLDPSPPN